MIRFFRHSLVLLLLVAAGTLHAQEVTPEAGTPSVKIRFSTDSIMLGDRFGLHIEVDKDLMQLLEFPTFDNGRLADSVEIVTEGPVDTLSREGRRMVLARDYTLTCFEPGRYNMGRFPLLLIDKNIVDTIWSVDSLKLIVGTFEIDTLTQQIHDIKPQITTPLRFGEISGYLLYLLLGLVVLSAAAYVIIRLLQRKPLLGAAAPPEAPHVAAVKALEKLHAQKLWQSGKQKQYYTGLVDIVRTYIEGRYGFPAMEYTSSEILARLSEEEVPGRALQRMENLLPLSDFVKFAKFTPTAEQNEDAYVDAYYFVEESKPSQQEEAIGSDRVGKEEVPK